MNTIAIVGGGIAGLSAAWELRRHDVLLFEASNRVGGKVLTDRMAGFTVEGGPDSFLAAKPDGIGLCRELGIDSELEGPTARDAFVARRDRLYPLPEGLSGLVPSRLGPLLRSPLLSPVGRVRAGLERWVPAAGPPGDETVAAFFRRRFGGEAYSWLIEPLMAGIYAGDGDQLSLQATFPQLRAAEGAPRRAAGPPRSGPAFLSPRTGMAAITDALGNGIAAHICTDTPVRSVTRDGGGYRLTLDRGDTVQARALILAVPAYRAAEIVDSLDADLTAALGAIPYVSTSIVSLGFEREVPLAGTGYLVPRSDGGPVLACTWSSNKWADRAPQGTTLIRCFVGRAGNDALPASDEELVDLARSELRRRMGLDDVPVMTRVHRWPAGLPQYNLGHLQRVDAIEKRLDEYPGLAVAGHAYRGVGIPDCIRSGRDAARRVAALLTERNGPGG